MATGSLLDEMRWMVYFSEGIDIGQGLFEKRMKQKGGKSRRNEENQALAPLSLHDRVQRQLTPDVPKLSGLNLKQDNVHKKYTCRYAHTHAHIYII